VPLRQVTCCKTCRSVPAHQGMLAIRSKFAPDSLDLRLQSELISRLVAGPHHDTGPSAATRDATSRATRISASTSA
jgi:hypothetical protein